MRQEQQQCFTPTLVAVQPDSVFFPEHLPDTRITRMPVMRTADIPSYRLRPAAALVAMCLALGAVTNADAGSREQAKRMHDRLAGVPPTESVLTSMAADIDGNNPLAAAAKAMENKNFYNVTLKNFITPWTNEEQTVFAPLNDYTATVIGIIRDGVDFREILSGNILYTGNNAPAYSTTSNAHYETLEDSGANLGDPSVLEEHTQTEITLLPDAATAGVITTRQAAKAFFIDGTNRAMFRFTLLNHLCTDLEQIKDTSGTPDRVRQDVSRSPGGDSRIFMNACVGCHAGMDPMVQAYAYYNYVYTDETGDNGQLEYTAGQVQPKYHINASNFEYGYRTPNDRWDNYWRTGQNSVLGWANPTQSAGGNGAKTMGMELANSEAFARCQVEKVFKAVCLRAPVDDSDRTQINSMITSFKNSVPDGYSLKQVFAESAVFCMGD
jgi:hypothetical protein